MSKTATERRLHFDAIVKKAERDFQNNPNAYKSKLRWLAFLGYGYLAFILLLCLGFLGVLVFMSLKSAVFLIMLVKSKLIIVVLALIYVIFKSLFIRIPAPEGVQVKPSQAPELFKAIKQIQKSLNTPKIHEVLITPELNAAIQQTPRLGLFGWQKNTLILGTELLMSLNDRQALAVVAHEMGHLSGGHSKFNGWIYRVRMGWMNILYRVGHVSAVARWVFGRFFAWYAPYFNAYSFALARANEFEADAIAAKMTSPDDLSSALLGTHVVSEVFFAPHWQALEKQAFVNVKINNQSYTQVYPKIQSAQIDANDVSKAINHALKLKTNHDDTHPAVKDRIEAVVGAAEFKFNGDQTAAKQWFGDGFEAVLNQVATQWVNWNQERWAQLNHQANEAKERLEALEAETELSVEGLVEKGQIHLFLNNKSAALSAFKDVYKQNNHEPNALYHLGTALLEKDDEKSVAQGIVLLERLLQHDDYCQAAGQQLHQHYEHNDMDEQANEVLLKMEQHHDHEEAMYEEISQTKASDHFHSIEMSPEQKADLKQSLRAYKGIKHAWLAGKKLTTSPDTLVHVILFELHQDETMEEVFAEQHPIALDGYFTLLSVDSKRVAKKVRPHCVQIF